MKQKIVKSVATYYDCILDANEYISNRIYGPFIFVESDLKPSYPSAQLEFNFHPMTIAAMSNGGIDYDELSKLFSDYMESDYEKKIENKEGNPHMHEWVPYVGFSEQYNFCKVCQAKKDLDPDHKP